MDFDTKASSIIFVIFKLKINFQQNVFSTHLYVFGWNLFLDVFCEIIRVKF
jgi:hypothetical protein